MTAVYSVIIPAYNEQQWLPKSLAALTEAMASVDLPGEVIVVDNNSTDQTAQVAKHLGAEVVFEAVNQISRARNTGARSAKGRYLIFLDADTILPPEVLRTALSGLSDGTCCGGGAMVASDEPSRLVDRIALGVWNRISLRFGLAAGCFIFCLREAFDEVGGFSEKVYASEEIWLSRRLKSWGRQRNLAFEVIGEPAVVTSRRKLDNPYRTAFTLFVMLIFPPAIRFRFLCAHWYRRSGERSR